MIQRWNLSVTQIRNLNFEIWKNKTIEKKGVDYGFVDWWNVSGGVCIFRDSDDLGEQI
jgi:hypothetical protein